MSHLLSPKYLLFENKLNKFMRTGQIRMSVLKQLVKLEATKIFIKFIMELQSKSGAPDALINELLFILGQLSQKGNYTKQ